MLKKSSLIFFISLLVLLPSPIRPECAEGCIKCGTTSSGSVGCLICDLFSSFYMNTNGECIRREIDNCLIPSADQNEYYCAQCKMGYILDPENAKCVEVPSNKVVSNCRQYTLVGTCKHCYQHYFLEENECNQASVIIENCRTYFGDDLCEECIDNYFFDLESNKCMPFEPIENCQSHSFKKCKSCISGFHKNPNSAMLGEINKDFVQLYATGLWEEVNFAKTWMSTCIKNEDEHCLKMGQTASSGKLTNACELCEDGYYLDQGVCTENPKWQITNCEEYSSPYICSRCASDFYLDCNECKQRSTYTACQDGNWHKDKCFRCQDTHYLDSTETCQSRTNSEIAECSKYMRRLDLCETCSDGFKMTDDMIACYAEIPNCSNFNQPNQKSDLKLTCDTCNQYYYLTVDKLECNKQNVLNCKNYKDDNSNICILCEDEFYYDQDNNKCILRQIENCQNPVPNENKCSQCKNLYYKVDDITCTAINIPDCLENNTSSVGVQDCLKCLPHRFLKNDGTRNICVAVVESLEIDNCDSNSSMNSKDSCDVCKDDYKGVLSFNKKHVKDKSTGCYKMDDDKCNQCDQGYNSVYDQFNYVTCSAATESNTVCVQIQKEKTGNVVDNNGRCDQCRDNSTHYLMNNTCWERNSIYNANCNSKDVSAEKCLVCKEGFSAKKEGDPTGAICKQNPNGFTAMTGCAIYNVWDMTKCVKCDWGYSLTSLGLCVDESSVTRNAVVRNPINLDTKTLGFYNQNVIDLAATLNIVYTIAGSHKINHSTCINGYSKVLDDNDCDIFAYEFGKKGIYADFYKKDCKIQLNWAQKDDGSGGKVPYVTPNECDLAYEKDSTAYCVKCKNGMNAKYIAAQYDHAGQDVSNSNLATVESCTTDANSITLTRKYNGLGFRVNDNYNFKTIFEIEFPYDSCPNEDDNLVVIMSKPTNYYDIFKVDNTQTSAEERAFCYDFGSSPPVQNCYVFGVDYQSVGFNYRTGDIKCVSCKPGYAPVLDSVNDGRIISECNKIDNCDTSNASVNTWMNGCETCAADHLHVTGITSKNQTYVDISTCKSKSIDFCLVEKPNGATCAVCQLGYVLTSADSLCSLAPNLTNCDKTAWNPEQMQDLTFQSALDVKYAFSFAAYIQMKFESESAKENCSQCSADHTLVNAPLGGDIHMCVANQTVTDSGITLTQNCKIFSGLAENSCLECVSTHIVDLTGACVEKSTLDSTVYTQNCKILDSASDPKKCDTPMDGYFLNTTTFESIKYNHCTDHQMDGNDVICTQCESGKMVDYRDKTFCRDIIFSNCLSVSNGICVKCESDYTLVNIASSLTNKTYSYCMKDKFSDNTLNGEVTIDLTTSDNSNFSFFDLKTLNDRKYISTEQSDVFTGGFCAGKWQPGCNDNSTDLICNSCMDGYWKNIDTLVCVANTIPNCNTQTNLYECHTCNNCNHCHDCTNNCDGCDTCTESYFVNSIGQCQLQNVDDCLEFKTNAAGCDLCANAHYLKDDRCYPHTVKNCKDYSDNSDECDICNDFFYLQSGKCVAHTISGCKEYSSTSDACSSCNERYYLDSSKCKLNTGENCKNYNDGSNGCEDCLRSENTSHVGNFIKDGLNCVPVEEIKGCIQYNISTNSASCENCDTGFFKTSSNKCELYPNGVQYCSKFASPSSCLQCITDYFLDTATGTCANIFKPIENCIDYTSQTECKTCKNGYRLKADNSACETLDMSLNCKEWLTLDSCSTCEPGFVLVEQIATSSDGVNKIKKCESKVSNCLEIVSSESTTDRTDVHGNVVTVRVPNYTCSKCAPGFLVKESDGTCETTELIPYCYNYVSSEIGEEGEEKKTVITCEKCHFGYWLSKDKKSCIQDKVLEDNGCDDAYLSTEIACNMCSAGYMMNDSGECVECGGTGCAVCDPTSTTKCSLCSPGYYMNSSNACNRNTNFSFSFNKEEIAGGDPINANTSKVVSADEGRIDMDEDNFGMKVSALVLGLITLLLGLI